MVYAGGFGKILYQEPAMSLGPNASKIAQWTERLERFDSGEQTVAQFCAAHFTSGRKDSTSAGLQASVDRTRNRHSSRPS